MLLETRSINVGHVRRIADTSQRCNSNANLDLRAPHVGISHDRGGLHLDQNPLLGDECVAVTTKKDRAGLKAEKACV